jgi:hypothetical protein
MEKIKIIDYSKNISQTVALPCYNAKHIGWLAVESLCRQNPTPYDWELIVCEEPHEGMLGSEFFEGYANRLLAAGCNRIVYLSLDAWVPLAMKWHLIAQNADKNSISFIKADADCYSPKGRLELSHKLVLDGCEWIDYTKGYFYDIPMKKLVLYDATQRTNLSMAFPTKLAKQLPASDKRRFVDSHLYRNINPRKVYRINDLIPSVDTDGHNNISNRKNYYINPKLPFVATSNTIKTIGLPNDIVDKLWEM